jgi:hypothetical protein
MLDLIICHLVELTPLYITVTFIPVNELTQFPLVFFFCFAFAASSGMD